MVYCLPEFDYHHAGVAVFDKRFHAFTSIVSPRILERFAQQADEFVPFPGWRGNSTVAITLITTLLFRIY